MIDANLNRIVRAHVSAKTMNEEKLAANAILSGVLSKKWTWDEVNEVRRSIEGTTPTE